MLIFQVSKHLMHKLSSYQESSPFTSFISLLDVTRRDENMNNVYEVVCEVWESGIV